MDLSKLEIVYNGVCVEALPKEKSKKEIAGESRELVAVVHPSDKKRIYYFDNDSLFCRYVKKLAGGDKIIDRDRKASLIAKFAEDNGFLSEFEKTGVINPKLKHFQDSVFGVSRLKSSSEVNIGLTLYTEYNQNFPSNPYGYNYSVNIGIYPYPTFGKYNNTYSSWSANGPNINFVLCTKMLYRGTRYTISGWGGKGNLPPRIDNNTMSCF